MLLLAPGDQGRLTDPVPSLFAARLEEQGVEVLRFEQQTTATDDRILDDALARAIRQAAPTRPFVIGGLSRGARVAATLAGELGAHGVLGLAYPFHPRTDPTVLRLEPLLSHTRPVMLIQGTRDSHGNREQIRGYGLPDRVKIHWIEDGNHDLRPRARSGTTMEEQITDAAAAAAEFLQRCLP